MERCAREVPGGRLVAAILDGTEVLCLKAHRHSRDYVNDYLVPLAPLPAGVQGMSLVYVDPETPLLLREGRVTTTEAGAPNTAEVGTVVVNAGRAYLKVFDTARADRHVCYVDIANGEVRLRQERQVTALLRWRLDFTVKTAD